MFKFNQRTMFSEVRAKLFNINFPSISLGTLLSVGIKKIFKKLKRFGVGEVNKFFYLLDSFKQLSNFLKLQILNESEKNGEEKKKKAIYF